jgi:hypothetical protein
LQHREVDAPAHADVIRRRYPKIEANCRRKRPIGRATHGRVAVSNAWARVQRVAERRELMYLLLAILLVLVWAGSFFLFHVTGFLIHILLIFAVISLVLQLFTGRK